VYSVGWLLEKIHPTDKTAGLYKKLVSLMEEVKAGKDATAKRKR
jgi:hypothetical protein